MLRYDVSGQRATITLDDPGRRNPLSTGALAKMAESLEAALADDRVRVIVFTGAGDTAFSAGGDLGGGFFDDPIGLHRARGVISDVFRMMRRGSKPTIARVNGHALAGGFGLAAACDIVVAVEYAKMGTTEIRVGLWPMQISAILQRLVPARQAIELFMTGRIFSAAEGVDLGVVTKTVPDVATLDEVVDEYVTALAATPRVAMAFGRDAFYLVQDVGIDVALDHLQVGLTATTLSEDAREGVAAFIDKRSPDWSDR
ncbi:MAG: enoyl-CoA hydratase-related protein [Acidimicrobiia bacterium]|nr:enoyl-CoA hydratase-related protein [Acidimicrobiia bacterium]